MEKIKLRFTCFLFCIFYLAATFSVAQNKQLDSLKQVLKSLPAYGKDQKSDTIRINTLSTIAFRYLRINPDTALATYKQLLLLTQQMKWKNPEAGAYNQLGTLYKERGEYVSSLQYYMKSLDIWEQLEKTAVEKEKDKILSHKAGTLCNIGVAYTYQGNYAKALEYYFQALKQDEALKDDYGIGIDFGNIALVYTSQNDFVKAIDYYSKAYSIAEKNEDKTEMAMSLGNMGILYRKKKQLQKSLSCYLKALEMDLALENKEGVARHYANIGAIYEELGDSARNKNNPEFAMKNMYPKSLDYFYKGLNIYKELGDKHGLATGMSNVGAMYVTIPGLPSPSGERRKGYALAEDLLLKALYLTDSTNELELKMTTQQILSDLYTRTKQPWKALAAYKDFITIRDTLTNEDNIKKQAHVEADYEFEKKEIAAKAEQNKKDLLEAEAKHKQRIVIMVVSIGLFLVLVLAAIIFRSLRQNQKKNRIITLQKILVEEKQKEILDSITYAKRLQQAILPSIHFIREHLPDNFIYYQPKDIVAGDFYWMEHIDGITLIAAADSTGHGVPGAMVSVVCSNALNRAVKEFDLRIPGQILDKTRELVIETFEKSGSEVKDGMDISLLAINSISSSSVNVSWSGAHNSLIYIENGHLVRIKADKQPIGKMDDPTSFTTHELELKKGTIVYLMTDGYSDQFGGQKGKKFKTKQLEDLLFENSTKIMAEQKKIISKTFEDWKGNMEQVDDVTIIGVKF